MSPGLSRWPARARPSNPFTPIAGGPATVENISLRCRRHNQYEAEQVFGFFAKLQEMSEGTSKLEVHDLLADDEHGVALVAESATRGGRSLESNATHVLHLRDGKVTEFWDARPDQYAADEFWS